MLNINSNLKLKVWNTKYPFNKYFKNKLFLFLLSFLNPTQETNNCED